MCSVPPNLPLSFSPPVASQQNLDLSPTQPPQLPQRPALNCTTNSAASATMLLDATTIQGLFLYTLYLLSRLGFFRWRDTQRFSILCRRMFRLMPKTATTTATTVASTTSPTEPILVDELSTIDCNQENALEHGTEDTEDAEDAECAEDADDAECAGPSNQETALHTTNEERTTKPRPRSDCSINEILPPEILVKIFGHLPGGNLSSSSLLYASSSYSTVSNCQHSSHDSLRRGRTLRQCMLVCKTWYALIGARVWKYPRVLWSRNWSRFYPIALSTTQFHDSATFPITVDHTEQKNAAGGHMLFPRPKDPLELLALGQDELHELDRHELEDWVMWRKREKYLRERECRRRRLFRKRIQPAQRGPSVTEVSNRTHPRTGRRTEEVEGERSDEDSDDRRNREDREDAQFDCPYSDDDLDTDEDSEGENSEDEGSLMKLVSGIDRLQSLIRSQFLPTDGPHDDQNIACIHLPFSKALRRLRQREAIRDCRRRMSDIRHTDGLPASLPLQMCGQWIQVINLQQETPTPQKLGSQSWTHSPITYHGSHMRRRRGRGGTFFDHGDPQHLQHLQEQPEQRWLGRLFSLMFTGSTSRDIVADQPPAPSRLRSRRDFVTDKTLETILEYCPGLCRLTISECQGITDQGFLKIRDSQCVARQTLVSVHLAGCYKITDHGFLGLVNDRSPTTASLSPLPLVRLESLDIAGCYQITDNGLIPFLDQCGTKLKQLRVSDCEGVTSRTVSTLAKNCHMIQWLDMARAGPLTDDSLFSLANCCRDLEWLSLARCHPSELSDAFPLTSSLTSMPSQANVDSASPLEVEDTEWEEKEEEEQDSISDGCIAQICEACPNLQLLDLSYIATLTNMAMESLAESAKNLVCLTIIGCPGITSVSLAYLARLRNTNGKLGCITMGDVQGISERDIEQIMQGTLSGWQKSLVDEANLGEILGRSWDE